MLELIRTVLHYYYIIYMVWLEKISMYLVEENLCISLLKKLCICLFLFFVSWSSTIWIFREFRFELEILFLPLFMP